MNDFCVNAEGLYSWIKECLDFFGLLFSEMNKVTIEIKSDSITAVYKNQSITLTAPEI